MKRALAHYIHADSTITVNGTEQLRPRNFHFTGASAEEGIVEDRIKFELKVKKIFQRYYFQNIAVKNEPLGGSCRFYDYLFVPSHISSLESGIKSKLIINKYIDYP